MSHLPCQGAKGGLLWPLGPSAGSSDHNQSLPKCHMNSQVLSQHDSPSDCNLLIEVTLSIFVVDSRVLAGRADLEDCGSLNSSKTYQLHRRRKPLGFAAKQ